MNPNPYKNLSIKKTREHTHINIRKRYEPGLFIFLAFAFAFIAALLFWLMPVAKENNPNSESNTLAIIEGIVGGVGAVLAFGFIVELLKRERIIITDKYLIIEMRMLGFSVASRRYFRDTVKELVPAKPPMRGWQKVEGYESFGHKEFASYTKDTRKIYPTICFRYDGQVINLGDGLLPEEAEMVINMINEHGDHDKK